MAKHLTSKDLLTLTQSVNGLRSNVINVASNDDVSHDARCCLDAAARELHRAAYHMKNQLGTLVYEEGIR